MTGKVVALDTTEAISVLNDTGGAGAWVQAFGTVYLPLPVVGELRYGALLSRRRTENLARIEQLTHQCQVLEMNAATAQVYARVRAGLKHTGKPIPENDVWIAALCIQYDVPLATSDQHFAHVEGLRRVTR